MSGMECLWVEFNEFGMTKHCPDGPTFTEMKDTYPELKDFALRNKFCASNCRYCLEGQKIEAINEIRSALDSVHGVRTLETIIRKYISGD